jgi:ubiquitin-protein ligase E3 C
LSPRLGVLNNIPFAIPFEARVSIFRSFIVNDKRSIGSDIRSFEEFRSRTHATVRRGHVAEDGFDKLGDANLKRPIGITFIDQFGEEE